MRLAFSLATAIAVSACDRPNPLVICHNSNCVEPHDLSHDDTIDALLASLALEVDGRPLLDGVEMDQYWHHDHCLFAHDEDQAPNAEDLSEAAAVLAEYLRTNTTVSYNGQQFNMKLELKASGAQYVTAQADCALAVFGTIRDGAVAGGHQLEFVFDSYDPALLRAVQEQRPPDAPGVRTRMSFDLGIPRPLRNTNFPLSDLEGIDIDIAEIHPSWITEPMLQALRSMGVDFAVWSFDTTAETLDGIEAIDPDYLITGQARTMRAWLSY